MIKLIATDMDGTLLNAAHEISEENINAIKYAQSKGITVVIATGRAFYEASRFKSALYLFKWCRST